MMVEECNSLAKEKPRMKRARPDHAARLPCSINIPKSKWQRFTHATLFSGAAKADAAPSGRQPKQWFMEFV